MLDTVTTVAGNSTSTKPTQADFFITNTFKSWVNGTSSNYGIGLQYATGSTNLSVVFKSIETGYDFRPRITFQYHSIIDIRLFAVANAGHDHLSALTNISDLLNEHGYTDNSVQSGEFVPSTFKLQLKTADIVTTRSHGVVVNTQDGEILGTGLVLNDNNESKYYFFNKDMSVNCGAKSYISDQDSFSNIELCLFIGCKTALDGTDGSNLTSRLVERGCKTAVGFEDSIDCTPANTWTILFYTYLVEGYSVEESVNRACSRFDSSTGLTSAVIYGDETYRLGE